ncbi:MAG: DUF5615 family PIN-like protein [Pirellulales bacterium]|nr:DUF5615 family PIN-like protein [Pirellulales bacterium]
MAATLRFLADENLSTNFIRSLLRHRPFDLVRAIDVGLSSQSDDSVLAWAADNGRIVISRDFRTLPAYAWDRIARGLDMPGVLLLRGDALVSRVIDDLLLIDETCDASELRDQVCYLPLE